MPSNQYSGNRLLFVLLSVLALHISDCAFGKNSQPDPNLFIASVIPNNLKEEANVVVRYSEKIMEVSAPGRSAYKVHEIVTILNKDGDDYASLVLFYNPFRKIKTVHMKVYDATGKLIKKYAKADGYDRSAVDGVSIITDDRLLYLGHSTGNYPFTVETEYEIQISSFLDLQDWYPQKEGASVQSANYTVLVNKSLEFRYRNFGLSEAPVVGSTQEYNTYKWDLQGLKATKPIPHIPSWRVEPKVLMAVNSFSYDNHPGSFSSWSSFGDWIYQLNIDGCKLSEQRTSEIRKMVSGLPSEKAMAKFLYHYLQQSVRYVSISLGIGGLKPFSASFVDEKKYGDCKALTNYMQTLLAAVGIKSYYALVRAGVNEEPAYADFPHDPFNHAILCIPFSGDTTWLECTSNIHPFGHLGSFTENRNALLITEDGGVLVNTPKSNFRDNTLIISSNIELHNNGSAISSSTISVGGDYRIRLISGLDNVNQLNQKTFISSFAGFRGTPSLDFQSLPDTGDVKELHVTAAYDKLCEVKTADKMFYRVSPFDFWTQKLPDIDTRTQEIYLDYPFKKQYTTIYHVPEGFSITSMPQDIQVVLSAGSFELKSTYNAELRTLNCTGVLAINSHVIPVPELKVMKTLQENLIKAQKATFVIERS